MKCPSCQQDVEEGAVLCPSCGETLRRGFPPGLYLLPVVFPVLVVLLLLLAWLLG